jgi:hypothetical protein
VKIGIAAKRTPGWPKCDWLEQAARNLGHDVCRSTHWSQLPQLLAECDVVVFGQRQLAGRWPNVSAAMSGRRARVIYWWFDLIATSAGTPIQEQPLFRTYSDLFSAADLVLVKELGLLGEYQAVGVNAEYCDQGCPSWMPSVDPVDSDPKWDLLVWGQSGGAYRQRVRDAQAALAAGFKVAWADRLTPPPGCERLPFTEPFRLPELAAQARCVLSCGVRNDVDGYWSDSFWLAVGMGACVARRSTPGLPDGPYLKYHTESDLCDVLRWAQQNPEQAIETGRQAREWVMSEHTTERYLERALILAARIVAEPASSVS